MYRKKIEVLKKWKHSTTRKPLILTWARQVGKTFLLKEFWSLEYKNIIYVNFENADKTIQQLFEETLDPKKIINTLSIFFNQEILAWETLIIFDEIQALPRALTSLKYFHEQANQYHVIASWSLLWITLHSWTSFPTGQTDFLHLEPMDFEEFLMANWEEKLVEVYKKDQNQVFWEKLYEYFKYYLFVGWMPEVVQSWVIEKDVERVDILQRNIIQSYRYDFSKHTDINLTKRLTQIWESIPVQFAKENDKFIWWVLKSWARAKEYELALQWLIDSWLVRKVNRVKRWDKIPLSAYQEEWAFKLYFLDVWLLRKLAGIPWNALLDKMAIFNEYNGLFAEQFVLQNLSYLDFYYRTSWANAEVDFVGQIQERIVPIEVKSWENTKAKSLKIYREKYCPEISVRFSLLPLIENDWLLGIPLYLIFCFDEIIKKMS